MFRDMSGIRFLIVDEADRIVEEGHFPEVRVGWGGMSGGVVWWSVECRIKWCFVWCGVMCGAVQYLKEISFSVLCCAVL